VITGAGRGLGRAYARLLAGRGASVVVNDLGGDRNGNGASDAPAHAVADEIVAGGGTAIPNGADVSDRVAAQNLIDTAVSEFGRIDVLINNAGISRPSALPDVQLDDLMMLFNVHLLASVHTTQAAWAHMVEQEYGRIVLTTSSALYGAQDTIGYSIFKASMIAMARHMRITGEPHNIKTNCISPAAYSRLARNSPQTENLPDNPPMSPDLVAPLVALLAHESCPANGDAFSAGGGHFARMFVAETDGFIQTEPSPTIEDVSDHWADINDDSTFLAPVDIYAYLAEFLKHVQR
jgi:NAD(P)-dependent dehydrogenase (short-subunit alcohol dehydrogenase family)